MKLTQIFVFCAAAAVCAAQTQSQTAQPKTTQPQAVQPKTAQLQTAQSQTAQLQTAQSQTAYPKTAQSQTAQSKSAQATLRPAVSDTALEDALSDKRFIQRQLKCALGEAPCDPIGKRLKTLAPLVLRGACPQCSPQETRQIQRTLSYVQRNYPQQWAKIVRQYAG